MTDWPFPARADLSPDDYLAGVGEVFARFDARTQDSGNVSFGVAAGGRKWFVKSAGDPFVDEMGRMFGSSRFMAPEEFEKGAVIDWRTTVFTIGRTISNFMGDGTLARPAFRGTDAQHAVMLKACEPRPNARFQSVAEMQTAWRGASP